jgi:hypothetical protein
MQEDAGIGVREGEVLGALADDEDELGLVVERLGDLRPNDRLPVRHQRSIDAHEDGREFRDIVALRAFLDVLEIIEAEADDLAGARDRQAVFEPLERTARACRCALGSILQRGEVAVAAAEHLAEIARDGVVDRLQIDHLIAFDHA